MGETPMMDQYYAKKSAEKLASEYTLKEVRERLQSILDERSGTHKDTVSHYGHNGYIHNNPTFNLDKDPLLEKNREAIKSIIALDSPSSQKWIQDHTQAHIGINTFDDVFAHCDYFKIPENKDSRYLTENLNDTYKHTQETQASVSCIVDLDNPVDHVKHVGGKADKLIYTSFELDYFCNSEFLPFYVGDDKKDESYPNMMHRGSAYYLLRFKNKK